MGRMLGHMVVIEQRECRSLDLEKHFDSHVHTCVSKSSGRSSFKVYTWYMSETLKYP